ncbi:ABC transporter permease [Paramicrobacterium chengjingii]|uniref:ABC transporter permease n=1 Tax=Paramicrobacterium chengjingii TaxID=2769067 RepID=A0ABX6YHD4_9MICO|nr:ABC transporter permease [Microbacterium chengjingii]QPZ38214.1 ABC transporter permease [Microbacterium chengjingii]
MRNLARTLWNKSSPGLFITTCITFLVICFIFIYPLTTDTNPLEQDVQNAFAPVLNPGHLLGTDNLGRDAFARLVFGLRTELIVCAAGTLLAVIIGTLIGILAAYFRGIADLLLMRFVEIILAIPTLVFAMLIVSLYGASNVTVVAISAIVFFPAFARLVYGEILSLRSALYVEAAELFGGTRWQVIKGPLLRGVGPLVLAQAFVTLAFAVGLESGLSFLGLGITPPEPSLGLMIATGQQYFMQSPWQLLIPSIVLVFLLVVFGYVADWVRDLLDPRGEVRSRRRTRRELTQKVDV